MEREERKALTRGTASEGGGHPLPPALPSPAGLSTDGMQKVSITMRPHSGTQGLSTPRDSSEGEQCTELAPRSP